MKDKTVVIIGGGVIGLFTAYYLVKNGIRPLIVDQGRVPGPQSCSSGNAGMIVPSHFMPIANRSTVKEGLLGLLDPYSPMGIHTLANPDLIRWLAMFLRYSYSNTLSNRANTLAELHLESRDLFQKVKSADLPELSLDLSGLLMLSSTQKSFDQEKRKAENSNKMNIPAEVWSAEKFSSHNPDLQSKLSGAIFYPMDGKINPMQMMDALASWLRLNGVEIIENCRITGWKTEKNLVVAIHESNREIVGEYFLISAGDQSGMISRSLGCHIPLQPGKGISYTVPNEGVTISHPALLQDHHVAITPYQDHTRIAGNFLLGNRLKTVPENRLSKIHDSVSLSFPGWNIPEPKAESGWFGFRPVSPDGMPILGRSKKFSNLFAGTGHSMLGISLGPISGKLLSDLISGIQIKPVYSKYLDPARFSNSF
jgi:D-amino-acid dehydrogenase